MRKPYSGGRGLSSVLFPERGCVSRSRFAFQNVISFLNASGWAQPLRVTDPRSVIFRPRAERRAPPIFFYF